MSQGNYIILTGYVTAEPKLGHTIATRTPVTKIRVGSTPRWLDRTTGEWRDGETSYFNVKCWRKLAENVSGSLRKGDMVLVRGKFRTRTWTDDQKHTRVELEIEADSVGHDMSFGWSHFNRGIHVPPNVVKDIADGEAARHDMAPDPDFAEDEQGDDGYDGGLEDGLTSGGPGDSPAPYGALGDAGQGDEEDGAFAALTRDFGQPAEEAAAL